MQVYVPIKLAFGKLDEAGQLLQRALEIKKKVGVCWQMDLFKHIRFYENFDWANATKSFAMLSAVLLCQDRVQI